jgi:iron complex outermembrane recepter protein
MTFKANGNSFRACTAMTYAVLAAFVVLGSAPNLAMAADAEGSEEQTAATSASSEGALQEVIVAARRKEESAQRVPIAITALDNRMLAEQSIVDVTTLTNAVPGVKICCNTFFNSQAVFVRGLGTGAPTYFDDVPVSSNGYSNFFDMASVEVLKGPQGTLFGQASNAGAFVYRPNQPSTDFGGYLSATIGNYARRNIEGAINIPLAGDRVLLRISGISASRDGYVEDISNGENYGNEDYWIIRPQLTVKLSDSIENTTLYEHSYSMIRRSFGQVSLAGANFNPSQVTLNGLLVSLNGGTQAAFYKLLEGAILQQRALGLYKINGLSTGCNTSSNPTLGLAPVTTLQPQGTSCTGDQFVSDRVINQTTIQLGDDLKLKNIFGYINNKALVQQVDYDGTVLHLLEQESPFQRTYIPGSAVGGNTDPKHFSDELQLQGKSGIVDYTAGLFYYKSTLDTGLTQRGFLTIRSADDQLATQVSKAIYGQANVHLDSVLSGLTATGGLRYTDDHNTKSGYSYDPITLDQIGASARIVQKDHNISYTLGLQYEMTPGTMLYVTNSRGYNAGGFNNAVGFETFAPSEVNNIETGVKSTFNVGGMKARVNLGGYYGFEKNAQVYVYALVTDPNTGAKTTTSITQNAASAAIRGIEGEFALIPVKGFEIGVNFNYQANKYTSYQSIDPVTFKPVDLSDTNFIFSPKWQLSAYAHYTLPLPKDIGEVTLSTNVSYRTVMMNDGETNASRICSRQVTVANGFPAAIANGSTLNIDCNPGYANVDMGAHWVGVMGNDKLALDFSVTNVFQNTLTDTNFNLWRDFGYMSPQPAVPRMWTLKTTYKF